LSPVIGEIATAAAAAIIVQPKSPKRVPGVSKSRRVPKLVRTPEKANSRENVILDDSK
jgi:hypothetical protein